MKEIICNRCGRDFWQTTDEETCPQCVEVMEASTKVIEEPKKRKK